jgi:predicted MPP superfamily phosphohydrolase
MPDTLILRFRDIASDDTVAVHQQLITSIGHVWWGWWKKDFEPDRLAELGQARERMKDAGLAVGLFDRSTKKFYSARAVDCIFSESPMSSPEPVKTPSYYSADKVPAWFKFTTIDEIDEAKFVERFAPPPIGEGTLFPVWRGQPHTIGRPEAIQLKTATLLHLSDIHLGTDYGFPDAPEPGQAPLLDIIERDMREEKPSIVVVSGDITTRADANVLQDDGLRFLRALSGRLDIPPENFVIVPGNHDIALKRFRPQDYSHEAAFHIFTKEFYGRALGYPDVRSFVLPSGKVVEILQINSVRLRHESEKHFGYVQWSLYDDLLRALGRDPDAFRVAVQHHHLVSARREESLDPDYPEASVSTTLDAGAVIEGLQAHGFQLALHGHQHVPAATRISRGSSNGVVNFDTRGNLLVMAAGSAGSNRLSDELRDNSYNVIKFLDKGAAGIRLEIAARRYNRGSPPQNHFQVLA